MGKRKKRIFFGNDPDPRTGWEQVGVISDGDARFKVFVRPKTPQGWISVKLSAADPILGKANYWIGWNGARWASNADGRLLQTSHPELLIDVRTLLGDEP